jgi:hypothetical protein
MPYIVNGVTSHNLQASHVGWAISSAHQIFNFPKCGQKRLPTLQSVDVNFHKFVGEIYIFRSSGFSLCD